MMYRGKIQVQGEKERGWQEISSHYSEWHKLENYELFISGIFYLILLDCG
jgi:hypothetical protein